MPAKTPTHNVPCAELQVVISRVDALVGYQNKQNGHLERIDNWVADAPARSDQSRRELDGKIETVRQEVGGIRNWILATLATGALGLAIAVLNFVLRGGGQ